MNSSMLWTTFCRRFDKSCYHHQWL